MSMTYHKCESFVYMLLNNAVSDVEVVEVNEFWGQLKIWPVRYCQHIHGAALGITLKMLEETVLCKLGLFQISYRRARHTGDWVTPNSQWLCTTIQWT